MVFPFYPMQNESGRHELTCLSLVTQQESPISPGVAAILAPIVSWREDLNKATTDPLQGSLGGGGFILQRHQGRRTESTDHRD